MVERRHFLHLLGGGLTALAAGAVWHGPRLAPAAARGTGHGTGEDAPDGRDGPGRGGEPDRLVEPSELGDREEPDAGEAYDGYGTVGAPPAISKAVVTVPMVFPVLGGATYTDTFLACRDGCRRQHLGQDLFAPKLRPVVAAFDAIVSELRTNRPTAGNYLCLTSPDGWTTNYLHLNNDQPGTDDGVGTPLHTFAADIHKGASVRAGQLLGWVGDSGNAEDVTPHLHFELRKGQAWSGTVHNPKPSLDVARRLEVAAAGGPLPEGIVVRAMGVAGLWLIDQGRRRPLLPAVKRANGLGVQAVVWALPTELRAHPPGVPVPLQDGLVVRGPDGRLWAVTDGRRVRLTGGLKQLGLDEGAVREVNGDALETVPVGTGGAPEPIRAGALLRGRQRREVWLVTADGHRRHVPDQETFASWGWRHADVVVLPVPTIEALPAGPPLPLRDGTLARTADGPPQLVTGGRRRPFKSDAAAALSGWQPRAALTVPPETLARLLPGFPMP